MVYAAGVGGVGPADDFQEELHVIREPETGIHGVIAIHSTALGPAAGGCRLWTYDSETALTEDAVRLARGMSYKNALAGLPFGGGKAVLQRPAGSFDRAALFRVFAEAVADLGGRYITAEDVGTTVADMQVVREHTRHVAGLNAAPGMAGGDPSPWTALGVFLSMQAAAERTLGSDLRGRKVAVQGLGHVGGELCRLLARAGARLIIADIDRRRVDALANELQAQPAAVQDIAAVEADVFAPCALGGAINADSAPRLKARLVCGAANNQIASDADARTLQERGVVYAPDYLVNAGGIINVAAEYLRETTDQVRSRVESIPQRLLAVLEEAEASGRSPHAVADAMAQRLIAQRAFVDA